MIFVLQHGRNFISSNLHSSLEGELNFVFILKLKLPFSDLADNPQVVPKLRIIFVPKRIINI